MLTEETIAGVRRLLERRAEEIRSARDAVNSAFAAAYGNVVCPACGVVFPRDELAGHAHMYDDAKHAVVEVMEM